MSAFLVSDAQTTIVAIAMCKMGIVESGYIEVAQSLRDANNKALAARYKDAPVPLGPLAATLAKYGQYESMPSPAAVNGFARCLRYQCSEGDVIETHPMMPKLMELITKTGGLDRRVEAYTID